MEAANAKSHSFTKLFTIYAIFGYFTGSIILGALQFISIIYRINKDGVIKEEYFMLSYIFEYESEYIFENRVSTRFDFFLNLVIHGILKQLKDGLWHFFMVLYLPQFLHSSPIHFYHFSSEYVCITRHFINNLNR